MELTSAFLATADRAAASAGVLVGHVVATTGPGTGTLIGGRYASPRRWWEAETALAPGRRGRCSGGRGTCASRLRWCVTSGSRTVHLTYENAAAVMTVVDACARRIGDRDPDVAHDPSCALHEPAPPLGSTARRWCSCGASAGAGVTSKDRWPHLQAVAFTEVFTHQLEDGQVGSSHGVPRQVTVQVDRAELAAGFGATIALPGRDTPVPLPPASIRRLVCDASITPVVVQRLTAAGGQTCARRPSTVLAWAGVRILQVGRAERTVTPA